MNYFVTLFASFEHKIKEKKQVDFLLYYLEREK